MNASKLSPDTRDRLLVSIASGLAALLKAAAGGELNEDEVVTLKQIAAHMNTIAAEAMREMGL